MDMNNYKTVKQMAELCAPLFTEGTIRNMLMKNTDGIKCCIFKIGGRVLFDVKKFEEWMGSRSAGN